MFCRNCGKEISDYAYVCPNCGVRTDSVYAQPTVPTSQKTNTLAIVGFVLAFFVPIAGLICSIIGKRQCAERNEGGAGLALAGLIISIVEMALVLLYIIIAVAMWASLISSLTIPMTIL